MCDIQDVCDVCDQVVSDVCEEADCPNVSSLDYTTPLDFTKQVQTVYIPEYTLEYIKDE